VAQGEDLTMKSLSMKWIVSWIAVAIVMGPGSGFAGTKAQADPNAAHQASGPGFLVSGGAVEFSPTVSFTHQNFKREGYGNVDHFTQLDVKPTVGFCVSDHYEVMAGFLARHTSVNGSDDTALGATAGLTYNFSRHGSVIPFVGLGFGALFYDGFTMDNTAVLAPMLNGGVRVPVGGMAAVNMSVGYQHESNADGEFNASANRIVGSVGVSLFPWRTR
jgi:hypothetical protein